MVQRKAPQMRIQDMTVGNPMKLIMLFAIPLFIGNIFQQIYTMVDTMVVGHHLGDDAIAAIGATASMYTLIISFATGMNSGYGIVVTRCFGAHNYRQMRQAVAGMMLLNAAVALLLTVFSLIFMEPLLRFMNTPARVFDQAYLYIAILCGGMVFTIGYNLFAAILQAVGNSRSPLYFLIIACLVNVGLDLLFVVVLDMGIAGAAIATVIAQSVSAIGCGIYVFRNYQELLPRKEDFRLSGALLWDLISTGSAMALMLCVVDLGSVIFQRANNMLGEKIITAHAASRKIFSIMAQPISTISTANSIFVGQNWGAKKYDRIKSTLKKVLLVEVLWALFALTLVFLFGSGLVRLTTGTTDARILNDAVMSLRCHFAMYPVLAVLICLRAAMQSMGHKVAPVISSCIELAMKIFSALWLIPTLGFFGTSITEPITWTLMTVFLLIVMVCQRKSFFPGEPA